MHTTSTDNSSDIEAQRNLIDPFDSYNTNLDD